MRNFIKSIQKIYVRELCVKADINRSTFYKYYESQYDLLAEIENDFLQELFLRIYEARSSYQTGKQFSTWAFAIAYNFCKNEYRHREIEEEYFSQQSHPLEKDYCVSPEFESMHDRRIFNEQLKKVLASLTSEQRAAYTLRYEEELSVREIAQILHCPEGTVKSRLYYTLKILQRSLSNYNPKNN